jgi:hypothetical protein
MKYLSFEVVPTSNQFKPFILDVPKLPGDSIPQKQARRAYWQAFHTLGSRGIDVDEFKVYEWLGEKRGREIDSQGRLGNYESLDIRTN